MPRSLAVSQAYAPLATTWSSTPRARPGPSEEPPAPPPVPAADGPLVRLEEVPEEQRKDRELVEAAVRRDGQELRHASSAPRAPDPKSHLSEIYGLERLLMASSQPKIL